MVHLQAITSHLPVTPMMVYDTDRWAHINVKLLHFLSPTNYCHFNNSFTLAVTYIGFGIKIPTNLGLVDPYSGVSVPYLRTG